MAKIHTPVCDLFGIEYPIFSAGMGGVSSPTLAATVSNAGGLGVIGGTGVEAEQLRKWIRKVRTMTDRPFAVDLLMPEGVPEKGGLEDLTALIPKQVTDFVEELRKRYGLPELPPGAFTLTLDRIFAAFKVICEERPPVYCSGLGTPAWVVSDAHANGIKVVALVGNVKNALRMSNMGVDVVVAQGHEAGGHTGRIGTLALVPQIVDAVSPKPVLAAGGIGDGRGLAAALALGAQGVWVGTRFICTRECFSEWLEHPNLYMDLMPGEEKDAKLYQQHIIEASEEDTTVTRVYTGKTARVLKNQMVKDWESARVPTLPMPLQSIAIEGLLVAMRKANHPAAVFAAAGQISGMIKDVKSVKEVLEGMVEQAAHILKNHSGATIF